MPCQVRQALCFPRPQPGYWRTNSSTAAVIWGWIGDGRPVCLWVLLRSKQAYVQALKEALVSGQSLVFFDEEEPFGGFKNDPATLLVLTAGLADHDPESGRLSAEIMGNLPAGLVAVELYADLDDPEPEVRLARRAARKQASQSSLQTWNSF